MHACLLKVAVTIGGVNLAGSPFEITCECRQDLRVYFTRRRQRLARQRRVLVGDPLEFTIHACTSRATRRTSPRTNPS